MSSLPPPPSGGMPPPPPPPPGYQPPPGHGYQPYPATYDAGSASRGYAGFGARLGGLIIDGLVTALIALPFIAGGIGSIAYAVKDCTSYTDSDDQFQMTCDSGQAKAGFVALGIGLMLVGVLVGIIVYCRKQGRTGQTWGAKALGFKVVDQNTGQPIGAWRAFGRQLARIVSGAVFYLGYLWMLWDPKKQTWHDKIVGTVVVKT